MSPTLADILGPWQQPDFESGLIARCRSAWGKPIESLSNLELVTCLQQNLAIKHILPIAEKRLRERMDDESELFEGQLVKTVAEVLKRRSDLSGGG